MDVAKLRRFSYLMDEAFRVPGTRFRFGWDPIIGLVPGIGDAASSLLSLGIFWAAFRSGVPKIIKARMLLNLIIDTLVGTIPVLGDLFDVAWKANMRNLALLEKHTAVNARVGAGDWLFVVGGVAVLLAGIALPIVAVWAIAHFLPAPNWKNLL